MAITADELMVPEMIDYFFGPEFNLKVAILSLKAIKNIDNIINELNECMQRGVPHTPL